MSVDIFPYCVRYMEVKVFDQAVEIAVCVGRYTGGQYGGAKAKAEYMYRR